MAFQFQGEQTHLYPLYSDMEHSDAENRLRVPSPQFGRNKRRRSPNGRRKRTRRRQRRHPATVRLPQHFYYGHNNTSSTSPIYYASSPRPQYTLASQHRQLECRSRPMRSHSLPADSIAANLHTLSLGQGHSHAHPTPIVRSPPTITRTSSRPSSTRSCRKQKRRTRTFYSKRWGNRLYGLTNNNNNTNNHNTNNHNNLQVPRSPVIHPVPQSTPIAGHNHQNEQPPRDDNSMDDLWNVDASPSPSPSLSPSLSPSPSPSPNGSLATFIEHDTLDLTDLNSLYSPSVSPNIAIRAPNHSRFFTSRSQDASSTNYDSAVSNMADNTDIDDEEATARFHTLMTPNPAGNTTQPQPQSQPSKFKIIVSAPMNDHSHHKHQSLNNIRMAMKRNLPMYMPSDSDTVSEDFSSSEDEEVTDADTDDDLDRDREHDDDLGEEVQHRTHIHERSSSSSLFLSDNNLNMGIYSDFEDEEMSAHSDTDYMSAQSGDFDELTICYHDKKCKNIKFRQHYLGEFGPSDCGSSDTDYLSSLDSIPDSVPDCHDDDDIEEEEDE